MKKILVISILALFTAAAWGQPRGMGIRFGATGIDASYEHEINSKHFLECDLGLDYGYDINGNVGVKFALTYNFILARPEWTEDGCWNLYAGPGITAGFTDDMVPYKFGGDIKGYYDNGFMIALAAQVGIEYVFDFPLALALDIRPYFGVHLNRGKLIDPATETRISAGGKTGFYDNGLLGFAPSLAVRYRF